MKTARLVTGGGTLSIAEGSTLEIVSGSSDIGATLDDISVSDLGAIQIGSSGTSSDPTLTLDDGTTITGGGTGTLTINSNNTLDIEGRPEHWRAGTATLDGVAVTDNGAIDIGTLGSSWRRCKSPAPSL